MHGIRSIDVGQGSEETCVGPAPGPDPPTGEITAVRSIEIGKGSEETRIGPAPGPPTEEGESTDIWEVPEGGLRLPDRPPAASESMPGGVVAGEILDGRFRLVQRIGTGGMSEVWEAIHTVIGRPLAVKVVSLGGGKGAHEAGARLLREAKAVARIEHPNVIEIVDFGRTPSGSPFLVMELLKGESLDHLLKRDGPMRWERAKAIGLQLIAALSAAHSAGVLHRDVKPGNVWIRPTASGERCKLLDFGISQVHALGNEEKAVTQAGTLIGTPAYMSPEQIHGNTADPRSDIYSVGAVLHAMLAGEGPYDGSTTAETLYRQLFEEPIPLRSTAQGPEIPPSFEAVVLRCLRKHPELRFPTMLDLKAALEGVDKGARLTVVPSEVLPQPAPELRQRYQTQWAVQPGVPAVEPAPVATESNTGRVVTLAVGLTFAVACCASVAALVVAPELLGDTPGDVTENAPAAEEPMKAGAAPKVAAPPWVPVVPIPAPPETAPAEDVTEPPADDVEAEAEPPAPVRTPKPRKHRAKKRKQEKPSEPPPPEPAPLPRKNEAKKKSRVEDDIREVTFD